MKPQWLAAILRPPVPGFPVIIMLLCALWGPADAPGLIDEDLPTDSWTYTLIRELDLRGFPLVRWDHVRPVPIPELTEGIRNLRDRMSRGDVRLDRRERWLLEALERELDIEIELDRTPSSTVVVLGVWGDGRFERDWEGESSGRGQFMGEGALKIGSRTTLYHRSWLDTRPEEVPRAVPTPWEKEVAGVTDPAYLLWQEGPWRVLFGRERMDWGPGLHGGMILSGTAPPLDMLKAEVRFSTFQGTAFAAVLDEETIPVDGGEGSFQAARYVSGHRITWRPCRAWEVSATEVIVYGGEDRRPEVAYLMPGFFFYAEQWNRGKDDNPLWAFDVAWRPASGVRLYGEYLVDDFQYESGVEPNEVGYLFGAEWADPAGLGGTVVSGEYVRIQRYTYGQNKSWNRYLNHGVGMGHPLGPDADGLWLHWGSQLTRTLRLHLEFGRVRKGEGRIDDPRPTSVPFPEDFPSGVVEKRWSLTSALECFPGRNRWLLGKIGWVRTSHAFHQEGANLDEFIARLHCRIGWEGFRAL